MPELLTTKKTHRVLDKQLTKVWGQTQHWVNVHCWYGNSHVTNLNASDSRYWQGLPQVRLGGTARPSSGPYVCTNADNVYRKYHPLFPPPGWLQPETALLQRSANLTPLAVHNKNTLSVWAAGVLSEKMALPISAFLYISMSLSFLQPPITPIKTSHAGHGMWVSEASVWGSPIPAELR